MKLQQSSWLSELKMTISELRYQPLPTIYGERIASKWTGLSNMVLVPLSITPYILGIVGEVYLFITLSIGLIVLAANIKLYFTPTAQKAWAAFKISSPYLAIVYMAVAIDVLLM